MDEVGERDAMQAHESIDGFGGAKPSEVELRAKSQEQFSPDEDRYKIGELRELMGSSTTEPQEITQRRVSQTVDYIYQNKDQFHYLLSAKAEDYLLYRKSYFNEQDSEVDWLVSFLAQKRPKETFEYLSKVEDIEELKTVLGMFVDRYSLPEVTEFVRKSIEYTPEEVLKKQYDRMGKVLLGLDTEDPRTFFTALEDLYGQLNFEEYETNIEATEREVDMLNSIIQRAGHDNATVVDVGCGTGRISNELAKKKNIEKVVGLDPAEENLVTARQGDVTGKVEYELGQWDQLNLPDSSVDVLICIGRTLTHARDMQDLERAFAEFHRVLKAGGMVIFDLPDNAKGVYLENRRKYIRILQNLHVPVSGTEGLKYYERVIDSPDGGKSLFDRYVPDLERKFINNPSQDVKGQLGETTGFKIDEFSRAPITGWEGAENIYYIAQKEEGSSEEESMEDVEQYQNVDLLSLAPEQVNNLPVEVYEDFLLRIMRSEDESKITSVLPVIIDRFERDLNISTRSDGKKIVGAQAVGEYTRFSFNHLAHMRIAVDALLLEKVYKLYDHDNPAVFRHAIENLENVIFLDSLNRREERPYLDLQNRVKNDLVDKLINIKQGFNYQKARGLISVLNASYGSAFLRGVKEEVLEKTDDEAVKSIVNYWLGNSSQVSGKILDDFLDDIT